MLLWLAALALTLQVVEGLAELVGPAWLRALLVLLLVVVAAAAARALTRGDSEGTARW